MICLPNLGESPLFTASPWIGTLFPQDVLSCCIPLQ